ncbi:MAG TPA: hypothetical protein VEA37_07240 [Flavobacterium sp.]|nr:hypothetical protein [Flavobacterium sp.]
MNVQLIEVGSVAFNELIINVRTATILACKRELKLDDDLLTQEEAMKLLKVKSKQKMKGIRESGVIKWKMLGGVFLYSKKSILEWPSK